ncbi:MAG: hypothetical protein ACYC64_14985 [Armatimonadota bacterium]
MSTDLVFEVHRGFWESGYPWNPTGVRFGVNPSTQTVRIGVGEWPALYETSFQLVVGNSYDFKIDWIPGVEASYYVRTPGGLWTLLYSTTVGVPSVSHPVNIRDETALLDMDRIIVHEAPVKCALLSDDFSSSMQPLSAAKWTTIYGSYYQDGTYATHTVNGSWGGPDGGFKSNATYGGTSDSTITVDFSGVRKSNCTTNDNWWGLWDSGYPWSPSGVMFRAKPNSQVLQVALGSSSIYDTNFQMTDGQLYDLRIVWTPGTEVEFYARSAGGTWALLYSTGVGIPSVARPIQIRDETMHLDISKIEVFSAPTDQRLLDDYFTGSMQPLDASKWTTVFGSYYQNGTYATHTVSGSWGGPDGGFKSTSVFGGFGNGTLTAEFRGVKTNTASTSNDNWWGLWDSGFSWNPSGVRFRVNPTTQRIEVGVGEWPAVYDTGFQMTTGNLYDFRIDWTPGVEAAFHARNAGGTWLLLYSTTVGVPDKPRPIQVRDETIGLDIDGIVVDSTLVPEPATTEATVEIASTSSRVSLAGFLHGCYEATEDQITALSPKYWRSQSPSNYAALKRMGIDTSVEFTYLVNEQATLVDASNKAAYETYITNKYNEAVAAANLANYSVKYWEFWNEGEAMYVWDQGLNNMEKEYYAFKVFYDKLRSLKPDALILAPSSCHLWSNLMDDFLRRCSLDSVNLNAVSWHAIDVQAHEVLGEVDYIWKLAQKYPTLGVQEIHVNEWGWPNIGPGSQMNFFYYLGKSGVNIAAKSIWGYEPLDNLFVQVGSVWYTRVSYWAWWFYAQMGSTSYQSNSDYPFTVTIAASDKTDPSKIRLIVSRGIRAKQYSSDPDPLPKVPGYGPPIDMSVVLKSVPYAQVSVSVTSLPANDNALATNPVGDPTYTTTFTQSTSGGQMTLFFPDTADEKVYLVTISPI